LPTSFDNYAGGLPTGVTTDNIMDKIRGLKNDLIGMIDARVAKLGSDSLPSGFDHSWVDVWESTGTNKPLGGINSQYAPSSPGGDQPTIWDSLYVIWSDPDGMGPTVHVDAATPNPTPYTLIVTP